MIIKYLQKAIDLPTIKVVSFDFFDTLVWRKFQKPIDLFLELGNRLKKENLLLSPRTPNSFALLRVEVEKSAREKQMLNNGLTEVTLNQIYSAFPSGCFTVPLAVVEEIELEVEREFMVGDKNLIDTLKAVRKEDQIFLICSDTYFSEQHLRSFMERAEIPNNLFSHVFTSCQYGISKSEGLLAKVFANLSNISPLTPENLLHIGDHSYKDGHSAKTIGAMYLRYPEISARGEYAEKRWTKMASITSKTKPFLSSEGGIFGISRRFSSQVEDYPSDSVEVDLVGYVYGPMLCGFAEWVGAEVRKLSPDVILCPTREGLFLSKFINQFFEKAEVGYKSRNFLGSRAALNRGNFFTGNYKELEKFFLSRRLPLTVRRFADIFGLDINLFPLGSKYLNYPIRRQCEKSREILMRLATCDEVKSVLLNKSAAARNRILAYFEQVVLAEGKEKELENGSLKIMMVDVGWSGSSQRIFEKIVKTRYPSLPVQGRYLMLDQGSINNFVSGTNLEGWLISLGEGTDFGHVVMPVKELIEQVLMADMPSVVDYSDEGKPLFFDGENSTPVFQKLQWRRMQDLMMLFAGHYLELGRSVVEMSGQEEFFRANLAGLFYDPHPEELDMFKRWEHEDNDSAFVNEGLVDEINGNIFRHGTLREIFRTSCYWHFGNIRTYYPQLAERLFLQQLLSQYGIADVYPQVDIELEVVGVDGKVWLDRHLVKMDLTENNTGIIVFHGFTEVPIKLVYRNKGSNGIRVEKVLVEHYEGWKHQVGSFVWESDNECIRIFDGSYSQVGEGMWVADGVLELDLAGLLVAGSYDITVVICGRLVGDG